MNKLILPEPVKIYVRRQFILALAVAGVMISVAVEGIISSLLF